MERNYGSFATEAGVAAKVTVADESADTTCFVAFVTAATGDLPVKSGTNLTFNSNTGALAATSFVGPATQVTVADESSDTTCFPLFATGATGNLTPKSGSNLTFNSATGVLGATIFDGPIGTGTATPAAGSFTDLTSNNDAVVNGLTIGRGSGSLESNTAFGISCFSANTTGNNSIAIGNGALQRNTEGTKNTSVGYSTLTLNTTGNSSTAIGYTALGASTGTGGNTAIGAYAFQRLTSGINGVAIGQKALAENLTGNNNVALGYFAGAYELGSDAFYVDNRDQTNTAGDKAGALLYGRFNTTPADQTLVINAALTVTQTLQWGSGANIANSNKVRPDYAGIRFNGGGSETIDYQNVWQRVENFDTDGPETVSNADQANKQIVFGDTRVYELSFQIESDVAGAPATFTFDVFNISQTTVVIADISKADPAVVTTAAAHGLTEGKFVYLTGCTTMTEPNERVFIVGTVADTTHFELEDAADVDINSGAWGVYDASSGTMAEATETGVHTHQKYTNGELQSVSSFFLFSATSGDAIAVFMANETNSGNITNEGGTFTATGK